MKEIYRSILQYAVELIHDVVSSNEDEKNMVLYPNMDVGSYVNMDG